MQVSSALTTWGGLVPLTSWWTSPERANVLIQRQRPAAAPGRWGLAGKQWTNTTPGCGCATAGAPKRLEPQVKVMVSPELRADALQATALHELGHAFGLWGHSSEFPPMLWR